MKTKTVSAKTQPVTLMVFGFIFSCIAFGITAVFLSGGDSGIPLLIGGIMGTVGLLIIGWGAAIYYTRARMGVPDIILSKERLQVGESFTLNFHHTFKNNITVERINIRLIFRETATYQQGTDTKTVTHEETYEEFDMPGGDFRAGHMVANVFDMQIPSDGMHTLKVKRNYIQWFVRVEAVIPRLPDFVEEQEIMVLPLLAVEQV